MPISLEFSPSSRASIAPQTPTMRPRNLEQLFSPRNQTLRIQTPTSHLPRTLNDMTYQVDINQTQSISKVPTHKSKWPDYGGNLEGVDDEIDLMNAQNPNYFPRSSTGIKCPRPPIPIDIQNADVSNLSLQESVGPVLTDVDVDTTNLSLQQTDTVRCGQTTKDIDYDDDYIPQYKPFHQIRDPLPIRTTCFHPSGEVYVIGSNSKKLSLFSYPNAQEFKHFNKAANDPDMENYYPIEPEYMFQFFQIHRSSVYCATFNDSGSLLATGSNDQTIHVIQYNSEKHEPQSNEYKLTTLHNGTIRDVMFMAGEESSSYLVTAAADNNVCITDCADGMKTLRVLAGHEAGVMSLHHWDDKNTFVSGSLDGTIRMWDIRSKLCLKTIDTNKVQQQVASLSNNGDNCLTTTTNKSAVNVVRVERAGQLLVSGHKDGRCMLYDIKAGKVIQSFKQHDDEIRTLNFSPKSYYLLTAGYDNKIKLMDLQGELSRKLPYVEVGELKDKIVQTAWHPIDYNFVTTCADGSATLWAIPES